tara:strand:+ start:1156 stop:1785 length:630 start_codon:yes stop_codon:yes gene_type:complete
MTSNNIIHRISKSRETILDILKKYQDHNVDDYKEFSLHEIDAMYNNDQLDMLINHNTNNTKTYIKYVLSSKPIRSQHIDTYIEDLFTIEEMLNKDDTLIIILFDEPSENVQKYIKNLYKTDGIFIVVHTISRLQFNVLDHDLVPEMTILDNKQIDDLQKKYNLQDLKKLPEINRFDPQALAMSMRPGQVGMLKRESVTALDYNYYRICI